MSNPLERRAGRVRARTTTARGSAAGRLLVLVLAAAAALVLGVLGPPVASASEVRASPLEVISAEAAAAAPTSPLCGGTTSHGKIVYQACIRFNCDSTACYVRTYMGVINKATGPRTVDWGLRYEDQATPLGFDGGGQITVPAGAQRTLVSPNIHRIPCSGYAWGSAQVKYDSTGWSPETDSQLLYPIC